MGGIYTMVVLENSSIFLPHSLSCLNLYVNSKRSTIEYLTSLQVLDNYFIHIPSRASEEPPH